MEHAPTVTLSYAFVHPEGIERPWSRSVRPMALALAKNVNHGRKLIESPVALLVGHGGLQSSRPCRGRQGMHDVLSMLQLT